MSDFDFSDAPPLRPRTSRHPWLTLFIATGLTGLGVFIGYLAFGLKRMPSEAPAKGQGETVRVSVKDFTAILDGRRDALDQNLDTSLELMAALIACWEQYHSLSAEDRALANILLDRLQAGEGWSAAENTLAARCAFLRMLVIKEELKQHRKNGTLQKALDQIRVRFDLRR